MKFPSGNMNIAYLYNQKKQQHYSLKKTTKLKIIVKRYKTC